MHQFFFSWTPYIYKNNEDHDEEQQHYNIKKEKEKMSSFIKLTRTRLFVWRALLTPAGGQTSWSR